MPLCERCVYAGALGARKRLMREAAGAPRVVEATLGNAPLAGVAAGDTQHVRVHVPLRQLLPCANLRPEAHLPRRHVAVACAPRTPHAASASSAGAVGEVLHWRHCPPIIAAAACSPLSLRVAQPKQYVVRTAAARLSRCRIFSSRPSCSVRSQQRRPRCERS